MQMFPVCSVDDSPMTHAPEFPRTALAAGLPARYLYWFGHSGRRYLFTATGGAPLADFGRGVAIAVRGRAVVWAGDIEALVSGADVPPVAEAIYVHLLARTPAERRAAVADLAAAPGAPLRLAA
jgi:hypothetical protein